MMVPPMVNAVPGLQWTGNAKALVLMSEVVLRYPLLPFVYPVAAICLSLFLMQQEDSPNKERLIACANFIATLAVVVFVVWVIKATFVMQEQMVVGMGLGSP